MDNEKLSRTIRQIVAMLVREDYESLENLTGSIRLTKTQVEMAIKEYPGTLTLPPESTFQNIKEVIEIDMREPKEWSVYFDLWTVEEGCSDLTLQLTLIDNDKQIYDVQIDDIHVL